MGAPDVAPAEGPVVPWRWRDGQPTCRVYASVPSGVVLQAFGNLLAGAGLRVRREGPRVVARPPLARLRNALAWCTPVDFLEVPTIVAEVRSDVAPTSEVDVRVVGGCVSKVRTKVVDSLNGTVTYLQGRGDEVAVSPWRPYSRFQKDV